MRLRHVVYTAVLLVGAAGEASAQAVDPRRAELGITLGTACLVSSSACGGGREAMHGGYGSWWVTPRVEIGFRIAGLWQDDYRSPVTNYGAPPDPVLNPPYLVTKRSRRYILGQVYRHFGSDPRIRFYAGLALGRQNDRSIVSCDHRECPVDLASIGGPSTGVHNRTRGNYAIGFGLSGHAGRLGWRTGANLHNFPGENVGATELFAAAGVRF